MRRSLALAALTALAAAGCGGESEGQRVQEDLKTFATALEKREWQQVCDSITDESRKLMTTIARGRFGPDADCQKAVEEQSRGNSVSSRDIEALEDADVDLEGNVARVKLPADEERVPLRRAGDAWQVDYANLPQGIGYALRASAVCTADTLRAQRRPLPPPTRAGIGSEPKRQADDFARLQRLLEKLGPPKGKEAEHERMIAFLRANVRDLRRASTGLRGFGQPLATYNRALKAVAKRSRGIGDEQRELGIGCFGYAESVENAEDYVAEANKVCRGALARLNRLPTASTAAQARTVATRGSTIGRQARSALRRLDPPEGLETIHRRSADALAVSFDGLRRLARATDVEKAEERFQLTALRPSIGFLRMGLQNCAEL